MHYSEVVITQIIINFFEIIAAIVGTAYLAKYRAEYLSRYFVYFLWFTVFIEIVFGWLPYCIYYFDSFSFLKNTIFTKNAWAYNIYDVISYSFYLLFFLSLNESSKLKKIGKTLLVLYLIAAIVNLMFSGVFFKSNSSFNSTVGTLLLLLYIMSYYFQILQSDKILDFYKSIPFYVSIGALIFHLTINPIFIYDTYYSSSKSPEFVQINRIILTTVNIFMYTCYAIGFIVCSRKNKSY